MQSVKSREDGKRLPEHFNSMISKLLSKWRRRSSWFSGSYKVSRNQPFLLPCAFLMQWFFEWVGGSGGRGVGKKNTKAIKCQKKNPKMSLIVQKRTTHPPQHPPLPTGGSGNSWFLGFGPIQTTFAKDTFSFEEPLFEKSTYNIASQPPERRSTVVGK